MRYSPEYINELTTLATAAMKGFIVVLGANPDYSMENIAGLSYNMAEAMLVEKYARCGGTGTEES